MKVLLFLSFLVAWLFYDTQAFSTISLYDPHYAAPSHVRRGRLGDGDRGVAIWWRDDAHSGGNRLHCSRLCLSITGGVGEAEYREWGELDLRLSEALQKRQSGKAVKLLIALVKEGQQVNPKICHNVIELCMQTSRWNDGLTAFELMKDALGVRKPSRRTWRAVMRGLQRAGKAELAIDMLKEVVRSGDCKWVDERDCTLVVDLCANQRKMKAAEEVVALMSENGIPIGAVTYCILIKGYGRQKKPWMVDSVLCEMREKEVSPDVVALNAAIDAYVRCDALPRAAGVLQAMEASKTITPNTRSYNTIIKGQGRSGQLVAAFRTLEGMRSNDCEPNEVTVNSLVDACVRCGDLDRAYALLSGADNRLGQGAQGKPSVEAFTSVLSGFSDAGDKEGALAVLKQMHRAKVEANIVTYTAVMSACINAGKIDDAKKVFEALEDRGRREPHLKPTVVTYNSLLTGLCRSPDEGCSAVGADDTWEPQPNCEEELPTGVQEALQLLLKMKRKGVQPNEVTMNTVIDGLASSQPPRMTEAEAMLELMKGWGLTPSQVTLSVMLKGYGKAGNITKSKDMFDLMLSDLDMLPDVVALNTFLDASVRNGELKLAVETLQQVSQRQQPSETQTNISMKPNMVSFSTVIAGLTRSSSSQSSRKAMELYVEMRDTHELEPDEVLVDSILHACCSPRVRDGGLSLKDGKYIIRDLRQLGWPGDIIEEKAAILEASVSLNSEVWKEKPEPERQSKKPKRKKSKVASEEIFAKYGWNEIESGWKAL
ncbi:unnamed protein product [Chrysoparadoxa australica]